jgi:hypothetical protein
VYAAGRHALLVLAAWACATTEGAPSNTAVVAPLAGIAVQATVNNSVHQCLEIARGEQSVSGNLLVLNTRIRRKPSAGSCGCKSAIFAYSISERVPLGDEFVEYERGLGRFVANDAEPRAFSFVLGADTRIPPKGALAVRIACAAVD